MATSGFPIGGPGRTERSLFPTDHSVVRGDSEYRFTITASDSQGFISITAERCAFP